MGISCMERLGEIMSKHPISNTGRAENGMIFAFLKSKLPFAAWALWDDKNQSRNDSEAALAPKQPCRELHGTVGQERRRSHVRIANQCWTV